MTEALTKSAAFNRFKSRVLAVVAAVPEGRVTTYGAIGRHLGRSARQVAFILANLTDEESRTLPWFRIVAANGVVSTMKLGAVGRRQIARLRPKASRSRPETRWRSSTRSSGTPAEPTSPQRKQGISSTFARCGLVFEFANRLTACRRRCRASRR